MRDTNFWNIEEVFKTQEEYNQFLLRCMGIPDALVNAPKTPKLEKKMALKKKLRLIWVILTKW